MEINDIFVVKRPFKSNGQHFEAGSVVDPASVRLFRNKINEGKVVRLSEQSIDSISLYIKRRTGDDITEDLIDTLNDARADMAEEFLKIRAAELVIDEERTDVIGTDVTGTDVTGTDVTGTDVTIPIAKVSVAKTIIK